VPDGCGAPSRTRGKDMRTTTITAALMAAGLSVLSGCGEPSTLSADDQKLCAEAEDELGPAQSALDEIINGDRHWSSDGEPWAVRDLYIKPAENWLNSRNPQDADLRAAVDEASSALFYVQSDLLGIRSDEEVFANDAQTSRDAAAALEDLLTFCNENG
jgi:hypothetical protein